MPAQLRLQHALVLLLTMIPALTMSQAMSQGMSQAMPQGVEQSGKPEWLQESDRHALYIMGKTARFSPESAAGNGLSEYDTEVFDIGPGYRQRYTALQRELIGELNARLEKTAHPKVRQDLQIMIRQLEDEIVSRQLSADRLIPYFNMPQILFNSFRGILDPRIEPERHVAALQRLRKYAGIAEGYDPVTAQAKTRTAESFGNPDLLGPYRGQLETNLNDSERFVDGIRSLLENSALEGWEDDYAVLAAQLLDYSEWTRENLLPRAREDHKLPPEIYTDRLRGFGVRAAPEELIADATYAYQFIRSEMKAVAVRIADQRGWKNRDLVAVIRELKKETIAEDRLLPLYRERLAALEQIIRSEDLLTLPEREASIRAATPAEAAAIPASFMSPPQLLNNTGQYGEFVLVQSNPALGDEARMDDWGHDGITWALTAHEARPGHELQFARLVEDGTSIARALYAFNSANVEGWGLYAESIVHQYLPDEGQLFSLYSRQLRAARMFLDPMVNTGQLTPDEAQRFLEEEMALSTPMANSEASRYAFRMPGQATAYYYGYRNLMGLRTELELRLGDRFNERAFHDFVLRQGLLPPEILRAAVMAHFVTGSRPTTLPLSEGRSEDVL